MGKIFRYNKPAISLFVFLSLLFFTAVYGNALSREYDLLQKGYESYLSYQPEKASEEFRTFLREFPRSSAGDAALFWLGKSLIQAKSTDEAVQVFAELKRQFPDSPFVAFIVTQTEPPESEKLTAIRDAEPVPQVEASKDSAGIKPPEPAGKTADAIIEPADAAVSSEMPIENEAEAAVQSSTLQKSEVIETAAELPLDAALPGNVPLDAAPVPENITAPEIVAITDAGEQETASPQSELPPEQAADIKEKIEEPGGKESQIKEPAVKEAEVEKPEVQDPEVREPAQLQEDQATGEAIEKQAVEEEKELPSITEEQAQSGNAGDVLPEEEMPIAGDTVRRDDEQVKTLERSPQPTPESDTMTYIQTVLHKVGIQGAIWSTGDRNQDFIDEQILYNEAVKLNLSVDEDKLNELRERYALGMEEADYLKRFLLICTLIDRRVKEIPGEKAVEVLSVRYKDAEQRERPALAAELQALANKGVAFEDISTSYPDIVHFKTFTFQELPEWIQERMQGLKNYEIGVIWSEEGYMILKPNTPVYSYDPFEELSSGKREIITTYIRSWINELKGATAR